MIYTLDDFVREYSKICGMGWIRTHRSGPTGIGKTLEDLLGIVENNIDGPDFGDYELKSCRLDSNSIRATTAATTISSAPTACRSIAITTTATIRKNGSILQTSLQLSPVFPLRFITAAIT